MFLQHHRLELFDFSSSSAYFLERLSQLENQLF